MNAQRIAGATALAAGAGLLVLAIVSATVGPASRGWTGWTGWTGTVMGPGMMGAMGPGMMWPGHMGPGHMWYGYGTRGAPAPPVAGAPAVSVTATDFRFSPAEIELASREVNLTLVNEGRVLHDLTVPALGIRIVAAPGQTATAGLRDLPPGRYAGYCSVPGHAEAGQRIAVVVR